MAIANYVEAVAYTDMDEGAMKIHIDGVVRPVQVKTPNISDDIT